MYRFSVVLVFLTFLLLPQAALAERESQSGLELAAFLPLSGGAADQGQWCRRGITLALEHLQARGQSVQMNYEDTRGEPRTAVDAFRSLFARRPFHAMLTWGSGVGLALSPLANAHQVLQIGVATGTPQYSSANDFNFRTYPSAGDEGAFLADAVPEQLGSREVALFVIQNDYGEGAAESFRQHFSAVGGKVVLDEEFAPGEHDFRTQLLRVKKYPDALLFVVTYPTEGVAFVRQARELGLKNQILASGAIVGGDGFFDLMGDRGEGVIIDIPLEDPRSSQAPMVKEFYETYQRKFGSAGDPAYVYAAFSYDAVMLLADAARRCAGTEPKCLQRELAKTADFPGVSRKITFDANGDAAASYRFAIIKNRSFQPWPSH